VVKGARELLVDVGVRLCVYMCMCVWLCIGEYVWVCLSGGCVGGRLRVRRWHLRVLLLRGVARR
jgi:hypothetical protein